MPSTRAFLDAPPFGARPRIAAAVWQRAVAADGTGLAGAALGYMLAVTLVITLAPFHFAWPELFRVNWTEWTVLDVMTNVLLFLPLGFVHRLARGGEGDRLALRVLALALCMSTVIEAAQLFQAERYSSPLDVATNGAGAWLGALLHDRVRRRLDPAALVGRLALELPLMGLVYLLLPLCWLSALTVGASPARPWLLVSLGLFGGSMLGAVQRRYLGPAGVFSPRAMAVAAGLWFIVAAFPALTTRQDVVWLAALGVVAFTWHRSAAGAAGDDAERRFEPATLRRAAPFFAAYLLLLPLTEANTTSVLQRHEVVRLVEWMAAFTLVGYMTAEAQGRRALPAGAWMWRVGAAALAVVAISAVLRAGGMPGEDALWRLAPAVAAAVYGAWLYLLQRDHVRRLAGAGRGV